VIIGADQEQFAALSLQEFTGNPETYAISPKILYTYPSRQGGTPIDDRLRAACDFAFPIGVQLKELRNTDEAREVLYGSLVRNKDNCYVFTINATDADERL